MSGLQASRIPKTSGGQVMLDSEGAWVGVGETAAGLPWLEFTRKRLSHRSAERVAAGSRCYLWKGWKCARVVWLWALEFITQGVENQQLRGIEPEKAELTRAWDGLFLFCWREYSQ